MDDYIAMVDDYADTPDGTYDDPTGQYTVVVATVSTADVPYFPNSSASTDLTGSVSHSIAVDKHVRVTGQGLTLDVAYTVDRSPERLVARYEYNDGSQIDTGCYFGELDTDTGDVKIWHASMDDATDDFAVVYKFEANVTGDWYTLTQNTNSGSVDGTWRISGGTKNDAMALMVYRLEWDTTGGAPTAPMYITCDMTSLVAPYATPISGPPRPRPSTARFPAAARPRPISTSPRQQHAPAGWAIPTRVHPKTSILHSLHRSAPR
jgi:hypothetical protein